jgi:hypothetical protein
MRPGSRAVISCNSQPFPSGSPKVANDEQARPLADGGRDARSEVDGARRAGRGTARPETPADGGVRVEPPAQAAAEALRTIDVCNRKHDDLGLPIELRYCPRR